MAQFFWAGSPLSTQSWAYDGAGNQTAYIDADGNTTDSYYDGGQMTEQVVVGYSTQSWAYDPAGNQTLAIDADGNTTSSIYDNNELVQQLVYQNGDGTPVSNETFGYDPAGNQTLLIDADGNTTLSAFDGMGHMTSQSVYNPTPTLFASQSWA